VPREEKERCSHEGKKDEGQNNRFSAPNGVGADTHTKLHVALELFARCADGVPTEAFICCWCDTSQTSSITSRVEERILMW